jgi:hypothetical protein
LCAPVGGNPSCRLVSHMPRKATAAVTPDRTPTHLVKYEQKGLRALTPLEAEVSGLRVTTEAELAAADELRGAIRTQLKNWYDEMETVRKPLREAKAAADELTRKIGGPLEALLATVTERITAHVREKARLAQAEEQKRLGAQEETRKQLEEAARREEAAKTPQLAARFTKEREKLEAKDEALSTPVAAAPVLAHTTVRKVKVWRLKGHTAEQDPQVPSEKQLRTILVNIIAGKTPLDVVQLNYARINRQKLDDISVIGTWGGFETSDDVQLAGKGGSRG